MAHEAEITVPGSFVVFQGIPGDGMANTIDTFPLLFQEGDANPTGDEIGAHIDEVQSDGFQYIPNDSEAGVVFYDAVSPESRPPSLPLYNNPSLLPTPQLATLSVQPLATTAMAGAKIPPSRANNREEAFIVVGDGEKEISDQQSRPVGESKTDEEQSLSREESRAARRWKLSCHTREQRQRKDWLALQESCSTLTQDCELWWLEDGKVAIFSDLPTRTERSTLRNPIGSLNPGSTVVATDLVWVDTKTFEPVKPDSNGTGNSHSQGRLGRIQFLKIESPLEGFVTLSLDGYALLGPGLPSLYADPQVWLWRVTCSVGAFVREGLELTTRHVETLPHGSLLRVTRKTVNSLGLSRLRVHAVLRQKGNIRLVEGWISEFLNPLSGQRGPIAQPMPLPVPAQYRVTLAEGAVVRSDVELSSPQIGQAAMGSTLTIVGRTFSEHPMDQCIERLKLAGNGGWISVRLNRPPPLDELVVELVGLDPSFDPDAPVYFHLTALRKAREEQSTSFQLQISDGMGVEELRHGEISSVDEDGKAGSELSSSEGSTAKPSTRVQSTISRKRGTHPRVQDEKCLICLTEERNSTIVHGETGHIACCLICARILNARGDRCPVCRLPIDSVIQHFWA